MIRVVVLLREQEVMGMSKTALALSPRQTVPKKYPRRLWCSPPRKQSPRIIKQYAPIAKATRQAGQARRAFPLPPFCYALPVLLFLAFCIDRTRRAFNRIAYTTTEGSKGKSQSQSRQEAKEKREQESLQACLLL